MGLTPSEVGDRPLTYLCDSPSVDVTYNATARFAETVKVACEALVRAADTRSCRLRNKHATISATRRYDINYNAGINRLPAEVFSNILLVAIESGWGSKSSPRILRDLSAVGKYWKDVIDSTPRLWTTLQRGMTLTQVEIMLERSKGALLDVYFVIPEDEPRHLPEDTSDDGFEDAGEGSSSTGPATNWDSEELFPSFLPIVFNNRHRLRTFASGIEGDIELLREIIQSPTLRHIKLIDRSRYWDQDENQVGAFELGAGKPFQTLELVRAAVNWTSGRLSDLTTISLIRIQDTSLPSFLQIVNMLESSPRLETLVLIALILDDGRTANSNTLSRQLSFPCMKTLHLEEIPAGAYMQFLQYIRFPNCANLSLEASKAQDDNVRKLANDITFRMLHQYEALLSCREIICVNVRYQLKLVASQPLDDSVGRHYTNYEWNRWHEGAPPPGSPGLSMSWNVVDENELLEWTLKLRQVLDRITGRRPNPSRIRLACDPHVSPDSDLSALCALDMAETLRINRWGVEPVVSFLATPQEAGGQSRWRFSGLKVLDVSNAIDLSLIRVREVAKPRWSKHKIGTNAKGAELMRVLWPNHKGAPTEYWRQK